MPCNKHYCFWTLFKLTILTFVLVFPITFDSSARDATLFAQDDDLEELEEDDSQGGNVPLNDDADTAGDQQEEEEEEEELEEDGGDTESADNAGAGSSGTLVEPFDVITYSQYSESPKKLKVFPIEEPVSVHKPGITPEDEELVFYLYKNGPQRGFKHRPIPNKKGIFYGIEYFEQRVYRDAAKLISIDSEPPRAIVGDSLRAPQSNVEKQNWQKAERLLKAGLSEHDSLVDQSFRDGRKFFYLRQRLLNALVEMELITIKELVKNQQFDQAEALCEGLEEHAPEQKHKKRIHQLYEAISLVRGQSLLEEERYADVRTEIDRLRNKLSSPSEKYQAFEKEVDAEAEKLFAEGKRAIEQERPKDAKQLLAQAMALSPGLPGLWQASRDASENHEVLNCVFIDALPKNFSPLSTETALDRHAASMLFEGLVRWSREPFGNCFTAELIEGRPQPLPKGRKFRLKQRQWSDSSRTRPQYLIAEDVRRSLMLAIEFHPAGYPPLWETLIDKILTPKNNLFVLEFTLENDYWSPLSLMNFPILPMHHFQSMGADSGELEKFNKNPVGTGAYILNKESGKEDEIHFRVNPYYPDPPSIEEVVFEQQSADEALSQMKEGKIDLLYDVRKDQVEQLERENIDVRSIKSNVVYMLVPNHGRSKSLKTLALRRAISYSINREELLNQFFRPGGKTDTHTSLQGIFPKHSWASHPDIEDGSRDANAQMHFKQAKSKLGIHYPTQLILAFPDRNDVEQACNEIKGQIETISTQAGAGITIKLKSYPVEEYDALVKQGLRGEEGSFDLAYWKHEYLDGGFWCESLFDEESGSNLHNYAEYGDLRGLFTNLRNHKQFVGLRDTSHEIDRHIASYVPIIPLWQLDTFIAFSRRVDLGDREIDPVYPFRDVKSWELK